MFYEIFLTNTAYKCNLYTYLTTIGCGYSYMSIPKPSPETEYVIMQIVWEMEIPTTTARVAAVAEP